MNSIIDNQKQYKDPVYIRGFNQGALAYLSQTLHLSKEERERIIKDLKENK